jgi:hypothetical protein
MDFGNPLPDRALGHLGGIKKKNPFCSLTIAECNNISIFPRREESRTQIKMRCRNSDLWFGNVLIKPPFFFCLSIHSTHRRAGHFEKNVHTRNNNMTVVDKASRFGHHKRMDSGGSSATLRPARKMKQKAHLHATKRCREDHDPNREKERE